MRLSQKLRNYKRHQRKNILLFSDREIKHGQPTVTFKRCSKWFKSTKIIIIIIYYYYFFNLKNSAVAIFLDTSAAYMILDIGKL